jgi:hypothetical protein
MWREMEPFIQQNVLLCDVTILFISRSLQRLHLLDYHRHLTVYTTVKFGNKTKTKQWVTGLR